MHDLEFLDLRDAIIAQSVIDYCEAKQIIAHPFEHSVSIVRGAKETIDDIEEFFKSQWYVDLMNGNRFDILKMVKEGKEEYMKVLGELL